MWIRQCDLDAEADDLPPIPSRIASNEEFVPPPQSAEQKEYEARLAEISDGPRSGRAAPDATSSAAAAAWPPPCWPSTRSSATATKSRPTRSMTRRRSRRSGPRTSSSSTSRPTTSMSAASGTTTRAPAGASSAFFQMLRPEAKSLEQALELLNRAHYVKEVFGDSDTVMAIISGVPSRDWDKNPLPPDQMVATRTFVNDLAGSRRVLSHGLLRPNLGSRTRGDGTPGQGPEDRRLEDVHRRRDRREGVAHGRREGRLSVLGEDQALGIKNLCVHKGLPLGAFNEEACRPLDLEKAAKDWPDLNFIVYHSGYRGVGWLAHGTGIRSWTPRPTTRRRSPGSATSCASSSATRGSRTSTSSWAARSTSCRPPPRGPACTCSGR